MNEELYDFACLFINIFRIFIFQDEIIVINVGFVEYFGLLFVVLD